eukprot:732624-Pleurochrysis_carterae.AAC.2
MQVRLRLRRNQEFTCNAGSASAKLAHFSSGHRLNLYVLTISLSESFTKGLANPFCFSMR